MTSIRELAEVLGVSFEAARRLVGSLEERDVLEEITGERRNRVYAAREIVKVLQDPWTTSSRSLLALIEDLPGAWWCKGGELPQARPNILNMRLWKATSFVNPTVLTNERELEAREAGAELWSICSEVDDYWRTRTVRTYGVLTNTTGEFWSEVLIACMMDTSEGSVREGLPLYGERRLADALGNKRYSSKIIKAGALLPDTKLLLETWDTGGSLPSGRSPLQDRQTTACPLRSCRPSKQVLPAP